ncbi:MAG: hypothetical protein V3U84_04825 [Thiotrichaceae bacterium]
MDDIDITIKFIWKIVVKATAMLALIIALLSILVFLLDERCNCSTPSQDFEPFGQQGTTTIYKGKRDTRPQCLTWYTVHEKETQWKIAEKHSNRSDIQKWLETMRWMSHKAINDDLVKPGETICIEWKSTTQP